jgi:hypothetical protein
LLFGIEPAREATSMNTQEQAFAATSEPKLNSAYGYQGAQPMTVVKARPSDHATPRRSPLPSVGEIDAELERKYAAPRYREI